MIDAMCQRWGQHPDAIRNGDTYAYRLLEIIGAAGDLGERETPPPEATLEPEFDFPMEVGV